MACLVPDRVAGKADALEEAGAASAAKDDAVASLQKNIQQVCTHCTNG